MNYADPAQSMTLLAKVRGDAGLYPYGGYNLHDRSVLVCRAGEWNWYGIERVAFVPAGEAAPPRCKYNKMPPLVPFLVKEKATGELFSAWGLDTDSGQILIRNGKEFRWVAGADAQVILPDEFDTKGKGYLAAWHEEFLEAFDDNWCLASSSDPKSVAAREPWKSDKPIYATVSDVLHEEPINAAMFVIATLKSAGLIH